MLFVFYVVLLFVRSVGLKTLPVYLKDNVSNATNRTKSELQATGMLPFGRLIALVAGVPIAA